MRYALFLGCTIPARLKQYEMSSREVLSTLGVELVDIKEFNCCGYPLKNKDLKASILASARNMALAQERGLDMLVLCQCGFGMLKWADYLLKEDSSFREEINRALAKEGLACKPQSGIKHLVFALYHDIGPDVIKEKITKPYDGLKIATHYGCHALRPSEITQFDDPVNPTILDRLVEATGAESIPWDTRLDCCGAPLFGVNDDLSMDMTRKKISDAGNAGADYLCDACPYCHIQFDTVQTMIGPENPLPPIVYPQLLGLAMGIDPGALGLDMNRIDITSIQGYLSK